MGMQHTVNITLHDCIIAYFSSSRIEVLKMPHQQYAAWVTAPATTTDYCCFGHFFLCINTLML